MQEQDIRAVESMCRIGMSLEAVKASFKKFPEEEIEEIFNRIQKLNDVPEEKPDFKINCS